MTEQLDGNTPMSAAELIAKGGQQNMLEDRIITLTVPKESVPMSLDSLARDLALPRDCWFKVANEWFPGTLHMFGTDSTDLGSYPVGVVEDETGFIHSLPVEKIRMVKP